MNFKKFGFLLLFVFLAGCYGTEDEQNSTSHNMTGSMLSAANDSDSINIDATVHIERMDDSIKSSGPNRLKLNNFSTKPVIIFICGTNEKYTGFALSSLVDSTIVSDQENGNVTLKCEGYNVPSCQDHFSPLHRNI